MLGEDKEEAGGTLKGKRANRRRRISGGEQRQEEEMLTAARMKNMEQNGEIRPAKRGAE